MPCSPEDNRKASIKVSVIIPTYNREEFIQDAIESVLNQTYSNHEIIVVDDGSTDNTQDILIKYKDKIKVLHQDHKGISVARNLAIKEALGQYLAFLDSDDIWYPQKLEKQVRKIEETKAGLVHSARYQVDIVNKTPPLLLPLFPARSSRDFLSGKNHISMTVLVRKEAVIKAGMFNESLKTTADTDLWLRIAKMTEIVYIDEPLMNFRIHGDNISFKMEQKFRDRMIVYQQVLKDKDNRILKSIWKKKLAVNYYLFARERYERRFYLECFKNIMNAIVADFFVGVESTHPQIGWIAINLQHNLPTRIRLFFGPFVLLLKCSIKGLFALKRN